MVDNKPLWEDDDDKIFINRDSKSKLSKVLNTYQNKSKKVLTTKEVEEELRRKYEQMKKENNAFYSWADVPDNEDNDNIAETNLSSLLKSSKSIIKRNEKESQKAGKPLYNHSMSINNVEGFISRPDITLGSQHSSIVSSVKFSPFQNNICITSGLDKALKIYEFKDDQDEVQLNEKCNKNTEDFKLKESKLTKTLTTLDMPIYSANFLSKNEILFSGRRKHYYSYDLNKEKQIKYIFNSSAIKKEIKSLERQFTGSDSFCFSTLEGDIFLFDSNSKQFKSHLKINGSVNSCAFNFNKPYELYCCSNQGEIYLFDIRKNNCLEKFDDEGSFNTLCLDIDSEGKFLASSQDSGIVNIYSLNSSIKKPIKVIF